MPTSAAAATSARASPRSCSRAARSIVGGDFSFIGGAARNSIATLNPRTGAEVTGFNPNVTGTTRPAVYAIAVTDNEVYIGGSFLAVGGEGQGQIARLTRAGALTDFDPRIRDQPGAVLALAVSNTTLYAGGLFFEMAGRPRREYAQFTEILTPVALDAGDDVAPTSAVAPLDEVQDRALFAVAWAGDDAGAGLRDYSVFVATDGGPFVPWRVNTPATRALFEGEHGSTYEFYSVARDLMGHLEVKAPLAEATTTVVLRADDADGDGVPDEEDRCADLALSPTVMVDGIDTGVANAFADGAGCTLADRIGEAASGCAQPPAVRPPRRAPDPVLAARRADRRGAGRPDPHCGSTVDPAAALTATSACAASFRSRTRCS